LIIKNLQKKWVKQKLFNPFFLHTFAIMKISPFKELVKLESDLTNMFDSDTRVAMAILEHIRTNKHSLIEEEKDIINTAFSDGYEYCNQRDLEEQDDDFEYNYYEQNFTK
jgi:ElaB/YqjD/DUF883 family membrane-anchored ribosome-binding protein